MTITEAPTVSIEAPVVRGDEHPLPQLSRRRILATWAAAALPMAALSWLVAPLVSHRLEGPAPLVQALLICLTAGLVWQAVLVAGLVYREQGSLRWSVLREALWLRAPRSPKTGRSGGRIWWLVLPLGIGMGLEELVPSAVPHGRDLGVFMGSDAAEQLFHGSWGWFGLMVVLTVCNTVIGEELLFRGYLLPRMQGAFGRGDWLANGVLFAAYHLHTPWVIPSALLDSAFIAYPSRRYRSAWMGIAVHSLQSVFILVGVLALVL